MAGADAFISKLTPANQSLHATQRYTRGWSDIDMWNFDHFLADMIVAGCQWYIDNGKTSPWHLDKTEWDEMLVMIRDGFSRRNSAGAPIPNRDEWEALATYFRFFWN